VLVQLPDNAAVAPQAHPAPENCGTDFVDSEAPYAGVSSLIAADACGCAPARAAQPLDRKIKLVMRLEPNDTGLRALVAVGADDCDPELRVFEVANLSDALQSVPQLLAAAEARWASQARYPMAARPRTERNPVSVARRLAPPTTVQNAAAATVAPSPAAQGQLGLFA
jgi:hypothetical protein